MRVGIVFHMVPALLLAEFFSIVTGTFLLLDYI